jgi:hypothetical protein
MKPTKTVKKEGAGGSEVKRAIDRVNLIKVHCKCCKYYNETTPLVQLINANKN